MGITSARILVEELPVQLQSLVSCTCREVILTISLLLPDPQQESTATTTASTGSPTSAASAASTRPTTPTTKVRLATQLELQLLSRGKSSTTSTVSSSLTLFYSKRLIWPGSILADYHHHHHHHHQQQQHQQQRDEDNETDEGTHIPFWQKVLLFIPLWNNKGNNSNSNNNNDEDIKHQTRMEDYGLTTATLIRVPKDDQLQSLPDPNTTAATSTSTADALDTVAMLSLGWTPPITKTGGTEGSRPLTMPDGKSSVVVSRSEVPMAPSSVNNEGTIGTNHHHSGSPSKQDTVTTDLRLICVTGHGIVHVYDPLDLLITMESSTSSTTSAQPRASTSTSTSASATTFHGDKDHQQDPLFQGLASLLLGPSMYQTLETTILPLTRPIETIELLVCHSVLNHRPISFDDDDGLNLTTSITPTHNWNPNTKQRNEVDHEPISEFFTPSDANNNNNKQQENEQLQSNWFLQDDHDQPDDEDKIIEKDGQDDNDGNGNDDDDDEDEEEAKFTIEDAMEEKRKKKNWLHEETEQSVTGKRSSIKTSPEKKSKQHRVSWFRKDRRNVMMDIANKSRKRPQQKHFGDSSLELLSNVGALLNDVWDSAMDWNPLIEPSTLCYRATNNIPTTACLAGPYLVIAGKGTRKSQHSTMDQRQQQRRRSSIRGTKTKNWWESEDELPTLEQLMQDEARIDELGSSSANLAGGFVSFLSLCHNYAEARTVYLPIEPLHLSHVSWRGMEFVLVMDHCHAVAIRIDAYAAVAQTLATTVTGSAASILESSASLGEDELEIDWSPLLSYIPKRFQLVPILLSSSFREPSSEILLTGPSLPTVSPPGIIMTHRQPQLQQESAVSSESLVVEQTWNLLLLQRTWNRLIPVTNLNDTKNTPWAAYHPPLGGPLWYIDTNHHEGHVAKIPIANHHGDSIPQPSWTYLGQVTICLLLARDIPLVIVSCFSFCLDIWFC